MLCCHRYHSGHVFYHLFVVDAVVVVSIVGFKVSIPSPITIRCCLTFNMIKAEQASASTAVVQVSDKTVKNITITFGPGVSTQKQKNQTIEYFRHLSFNQVIENNKVIGFTFNIDEFNEVVYKGCVQQKRKKCVSTQTDRCPSPSILTEGNFTSTQVDRCHSPSILTGSSYTLYQRLEFIERENNEDV